MRPDWEATVVSVADPSAKGTTAVSAAVRHNIARVTGGSDTRTAGRFYRLRTRYPLAASESLTRAT